MDGYTRTSKYGSRRIALVDVPHAIQAHVIEVVTAAIFTHLAENGNDAQDTPVAQVETVTLTGTGGTATITGVGGLSKVVTWDTNLTDTAAAFVTSFAAAYKLEAVIVTSSGADIIFTAAIIGTPIVAPVITPATGDLDGTVAHTTANVGSSLGDHGVYGELAAGEKIQSATKFTSVMISGGVIVCY